MNAGRWKQIDGLFAAVLEMPEAERENFLLKNCVGDEDLKNEVLRLLRVAPRAGSFLETSALGIAAKNLAADKTTIPGACFSGKTIGTYRIEKPLGAGGLAGISGLVWHDLRATFGTRLGEAGFDAFTIADLMGHSDVRTTRRYVQATERTKRAAVEAATIQNNIDVHRVAQNRKRLPTKATVTAIKEMVGAR